MSIEAMKLALEMVQNKMFAHAEMYLSEAIEQAEKQEPVAWELGAEVYWHESPELSDYVRKEGTPLYTSPPQRQPLTDEQIEVLFEDGLAFENYTKVVREIEAAHGITGDTHE